MGAAGEGGRVTVRGRPTRRVRRSALILCGAQIVDPVLGGATGGKKRHLSATKTKVRGQKLTLTACGWIFCLASRSERATRLMLRKCLSEKINLVSVGVWILHYRLAAAYFPLVFFEQHFREAAAPLLCMIVWRIVQLTACLLPPGKTAVVPLHIQAV